MSTLNVQKITNLSTLELTSTLNVSTLNVSSILVNGTPPITTILANTSVGTGTTYTIDSSKITKAYRKLEVFARGWSHNSSNQLLNIEWSVDNGTTIVGPVVVGAQSGGAGSVSAVINFINADVTTAGEFRQIVAFGSASGASYTYAQDTSTTATGYVNWLRFSFTAGNFDAGTILAYGYQ